MQVVIIHIEIIYSKNIYKNKDTIIIYGDSHMCINITFVNISLDIF